MTATATREYAGPVSRTLAYLIDAFVVGVVFTAGAAIAAMITSVMGGRWHALAPATASARLVLLPALLAAYWWLFWTLAGRSPGMALFGLRVVATRARRLTWPAALLRALVLTAFPIGAIWALVDRRRQALHDKLARTTVVRMP